MQTQSGSHVMEIVTASLATYKTPDQYDPIVRNEPAKEPTQYTQMTPDIYQHLGRVLNQAQSSLSVQNPGGFISPPPSKQTEDVIRLLIELFERRKNVQEYHGASSFNNPRDWMLLISTDVPVGQIQQQQFTEILPINEVQKLMATARPNQPIKLPPRQPDPRYRLVDQLSKLYNIETANIPVPQLVEPLYRVLDWQAQQEVQAEKLRERIKNGLTLPNLTPLLNRQGRCSNDSHALWLPDSELIDERFLYERYKMLIDI